MGRRRRRTRGGPHGAIIVDKPAGPTSRYVVEGVRRALGAGRAGHAGTLDPMATGVLVVLLGEGTKLSQWAVSHDKGYRAWVRLGSGTDTLDAEGEVIESAPIPPEALDRAHVESVLAGFIGDVEQRAPAYSAIKVDGRTLMSRARAGEAVDAPVRRVRCDRLDLVAFEGADTLVIDVACGKGYYVRALARDLGVALGVPAHLSALRRTRSGGFDVADAVPLDAVAASDVRPLTEALPEIPVATLSAVDAARIGHGVPVAAPLDGPPRAIAVDGSGAPLAMVERVDGDWVVARGFRLDDEPATD